MRPDAVVFDMDGVLLNTEVIFDDAWRKAAKQLQIADIEPAIRDCRGVTRQFIREYFGMAYPEVDFDGFDELCDRFYDEIIAGGVPVMAGVTDILRNLRCMGVKTAVATSSARTRTVAHLESAGIFGLFDAVVCGDSIARSKPAPDIYLAAAQALGVNPVRCIGVEDSHNGVRSAHAAGMKVAMVIDQMPATDEMRGLCWHIFDDLHQLNDVITDA